MRIAYVINQYPMVSTTFIRREILALERQGMRVERIALRGWDTTVMDSEDVFDANSIGTLVERLQRVLVAMTTDPSRPLSSIDVLDSAEHARLDEVGNRAGGERLDTLLDADRRRLAAALLLCGPYVPLLFMVDQKNKRGRSQALKAGAQDYITRPIDFPALLNRVTQQIEYYVTLHQLRDSNDRFTLAAAGSNDGLWDYDLVEGRLFVSDRWLELLGLVGRENEQDPGLWFDRIHEDDKSDFQTKLRALMIGAEPELVADFRMRHNDGGFRWVRARGVAELELNDNESLREFRPGSDKSIYQIQTRTFRRIRPRI